MRRLLTSAILAVCVLAPLGCSLSSAGDGVPAVPTYERPSVTTDPDEP